VYLVVQPLHRLHQIVRQLAADAAALELDEGLAAAAEQRPVDAELTDLVRDDRHAHTVALRRLEQVAHQRGLARAEEARDDQGRDPLRRFAVVRVRHDATR
jgi:hypothetical protein